MAEAKRLSRINELENEQKGLEFLLQQLKQVEDYEVSSFLSVTGYSSRQEIESALAKVTQSLRKSKGEQVETEEKAESSMAEKYNLINVPDDVLTPEQVWMFPIYFLKSSMLKFSITRQFFTHGHLCNVGCILILSNIIWKM